MDVGDFSNLVRIGAAQYAQPSPTQPYAPRLAQSADFEKLFNAGTSASPQYGRNAYAPESPLSQQCDAAAIASSPDVSRLINIPERERRKSSHYEYVAEATTIQPRIVPALRINTELTAPRVGSDGPVEIVSPVIEPESSAAMDAVQREENAVTHLHYVDLEGLHDLIQGISLSIASMSHKLRDDGQLLKHVNEMRDSFLFHKSDLARFVTFVPNSHGPPPPSHEPEYQLFEFYQLVWAFSNKIKQQQAKAWTPTSIKRKRLDGCLNRVREKWRHLLLVLSISIAQWSSITAEKASGNVAKLAVATGAPDWEELTLDDSRMLFLQGEKYLLGYGVPKSLDIAYKRYMASAQQDLPEAAHMLGFIYENGLGRPKDMAAALYWYKKAASREYPEALNSLGKIYEHGKGVPTDYSAAAGYYQRAAERGSLNAMTNIGYLLENGYGCGRSCETAARWYYAAAQEGDARAQNYYGSCLYKGKGVKQDYGQAVEWYRKSSAQGNPSAHNNLGICYEEGLGVARDVGMAKTLYKMASDARHPSGTNNLGYMYLTEHQYREAFRIFHVAVSLNSIDACYNLGIMYERGCSDADGEFVVSKDTSMALKYFEEAAEKDHLKALLHLSALLTTLDPPYFRPEQARQLLHRAADRYSSPDAFNLLGQLYEHGLGLPAPDLEQAGTWYKKAAREGHSGGLFNLAVWYESGNEGEDGRKRAAPLMAEACRKGNQEAIARLHQMQNDPIGSEF